MNDAKIFRTEAVEATKATWLGEIVLIRPVSFKIFAWIAVGMTALLIVFLFFGSYTRRTTVNGQIEPNLGVLRLYSSQPGTVLEKHVREGQRVSKGSLLYLISTERRDSNINGIQATISAKVASREQSLRSELARTRRILHEEEQSLRRKIDALRDEVSNVTSQLAVQKSRTEVARSNLERSTSLLSDGFISAEMTQQKVADLLDQQSRLKALERDQINLNRELQAVLSELERLPALHTTRLAQLDRMLVSTTQEWTESEGKRNIGVVASADGMAAFTSGEIGQSVDGTKPLVSIIPTGAKLEAHLYAPSRAIGFVRPGDAVLLRYSAFPYQKFGHASGKVAFISRTAMLSGELPDQLGKSEPFYRIKVTLLSQTVLAYGKEHPLQPGMLVEADILHENRKLYEWALEPLLTLSGTL